MLVNYDLVLHHANNDPIAIIIGGGKKAFKITKGIYQVGHFGSSPYLPGLIDPFKNKDYSLEGIDYEYGVCDNYEQILEKNPIIKDHPTRKFFINLTEIRKDEQDAQGGWRWHKWGPYIGTQQPTKEYIYDEPIIEKVYVFHIYELENK